MMAQKNWTPRFRKCFPFPIPGRSTGIHVVRIQTVTGSSFDAELIPELRELHAIRDALPEPFHSTHDGIVSRCRFGRSRRHGPRRLTALP